MSIFVKVIVKKSVAPFLCGHGVDALNVLCEQLTRDLFAIAYFLFLWTPAQRKRASMLYFANVFFLFFYAALFSGPGERRFAKVLHVVDLECH